MQLDPELQKQVEELIAKKVDIVEAVKNLDVRQREQLAQDLEPYLYGRQQALRSPKNTYTPRWTLGSADVNSDNSSVGKGHAGPTLPETIDLVGGGAYLDSDDPSILHINPAKTAPCYDYVIDSAGHGTHTSLSAFFTDTAVQAAAAGSSVTGLIRVWLCTSTRITTSIDLTAGSGWSGADTEDRGILFSGGGGNVGQKIEFTGSRLFKVDSDTLINMAFENVWIYGSGEGDVFQQATGSGSPLITNSNIVFKDCIIDLGGSGSIFNSTVSGGGWGGAIILERCSGQMLSIATTDQTSNTAANIYVNNCRPFTQYLIDSLVAGQRFQFTDRLATWGTATDNSAKEIVVTDTTWKQSGKNALVTDVNSPKVRIADVRVDYSSAGTDSCILSTDNPPNGMFLENVECVMSGTGTKFYTGTYATTQSTSPLVFDDIVISGAGGAGPAVSVSATRTPLLLLGSIMCARFTTCYSGPAGTSMPGGGSANSGSQYLTLAADAQLMNERIWTPGSGLSGTDAGAGSTYTAALGNLTGNWTQAGVFDISTAGNLTVLKHLAVGASASASTTIIADIADSIANSSAEGLEVALTTTSAGVGGDAMALVAANTFLVGSGTQGKFGGIWGKGIANPASGGPTISNFYGGRFTISSPVGSGGQGVTLTRAMGLWVPAASWGSTATVTESNVLYGEDQGKSGALAYGLHILAQTGTNVRNSIADPLVVGTDAAPGDSQFIVASTTKASIPAPKMSGAQRDAIASPVSGMQVYSTDNNQTYVYNGSAWVSTTNAHIFSWFSQTPVTGDNLAYHMVRFNGAGCTGISPLQVTAKDYGYGTTTVNLLRAPSAHTVGAAGGLPNPNFSTVLTSDLNIESAHMTMTGLEDVTISGGALSSTTFAFDDEIRVNYDSVNNPANMNIGLTVTIP